MDTNLRHRLRLTAAIALATFALAGCSGSGASSDVDAGYSGGSGADSAGEVAPEDGGSVPMSPTDVSEREVVVTAFASLLVDDSRQAVSEVVAVVTTVDGRVQSREEYAGGGEHDPAWATLVLRVPSGDLPAVIEHLADVGEVQSVSQTEEDVTSTAVDLDARIAALETSTARLLEIMANAEDTDDLLATERTLSERQADLEALKSQRNALTDRVTMSTLTVTFETVPASPAAARGGFLGGLESGWNALILFVGNALVVLGALIPWAVAIGVPAGVVLAVMRRRRRNAPAPAAPPAG